METLGDDFDSGPAFRDTAAVMSLLDLVVTTDTAVAHLAGALGRPTWVALRFSPDWRWLLGTDTSVWYPTMRLFRQPTAGDWHSVFARMAEELPRLGRAGAAAPRDFTQFSAFMDHLAASTAPDDDEVNLSVEHGTIERLHGDKVLNAGMRVLVVGAAHGKAVDKFASLGIDATGVDPSQGFPDAPAGGFDVVWSCHALERSVAPLYTLSEYKRLLKPGGLLYVQLPAPDTAAHHEAAPRNLSVLPLSAWGSLLGRIGFTLDLGWETRFDSPQGADLYWSFLLRRP